MININISTSQNQAFSSYYSIVIEWMHNRHFALKDSEHLLNKFVYTENMNKVMSYFLKLVGSFNDVYVSQSRIAQATGLGLRTVHRILQILSLIGLINKKYRGANRTCLYTRGPLLLDPNFKFSVMGILPRLYWATESLAARCKAKINMITSSLAARFGQVGVRLSNDNNKELKTYKKEPEFTPTDQDLRRYYEHEERIKQKKDDFAQEMAKLLGIQT